MLRSFTYFPGTSLWFVNTCHLYGSSVLVEYFQTWRPQKRDFFNIESSNWMAYIACWCEHFVRCKNIKQMTRFGGEKFYYSLPQIGGLKLKTTLFCHYTEKLEIL